MQGSGSSLVALSNEIIASYSDISLNEIGVDELERIRESQSSIVRIVRIVSVIIYARCIAMLRDVFYGREVGTVEHVNDCREYTGSGNGRTIKGWQCGLKFIFIFVWCYFCGCSLSHLGGHGWV